MANKTNKAKTNEEKSRILAWRQERVPIKVICERSGRAISTVLKPLAYAKDLLNTEVPKHKFGV